MIFMNEQSSHPELSEEQKNELKVAGIEVLLGKLAKLPPHSDRMKVYVAVLAQS